jgi:hypothetical protein
MLGETPSGEDQKHSLSISSHSQYGAQGKLPMQRYLAERIRNIAYLYLLNMASKGRSFHLAETPGGENQKHSLPIPSQYGAQGT